MFTGKGKKPSVTSKLSHSRGQHCQTAGGQQRTFIRTSSGVSAFLAITKGKNIYHDGSLPSWKSPNCPHFPGLAFPFVCHDGGPGLLSLYSTLVPRQGLFTSTRKKGLSVRLLWKIQQRLVWRGQPTPDSEPGGPKSPSKWRFWNVLLQQQLVFWVCLLRCAASARGRVETGTGDTHTFWMKWKTFWINALFLLLTAPHFGWRLVTTYTSKPGLKRQ